MGLGGLLTERLTAALPASFCRLAWQEQAVIHPGDPAAGRGSSHRLRAVPVDYLHHILSPQVGVWVRTLAASRRRVDPSIDLSPFERRQIVSDWRLRLFLSADRLDPADEMIRLFARECHAVRWQETFSPRIGTSLFEARFKVPDHPFFRGLDREQRHSLLDILLLGLARPWWVRAAAVPEHYDTATPLPLRALVGLDRDARRDLWDYVVHRKRPAGDLRDAGTAYFRQLYRESVREIGLGILKEKFLHCLQTTDLSPLLVSFLRRTLLCEEVGLTGGSEDEPFRLNLRQIADARQVIREELAERRYLDMHVLPFCRERIGRLPQWRVRLARRGLDGAAILVPYERPHGLFQRSGFGQLVTDAEAVAATDGLSLIHGVRVTVPRGEEHASFPRLAGLFVSDVVDGIPADQFAYEVSCQNGIVLIPDGPSGDSWLLKGDRSGTVLAGLTRQVGPGAVVLEAWNLKAGADGPAASAARLAEPHTARHSLTAGSGAHLDSVRLGWSGIVIERFSTRDEFLTNLPEARLVHRGLEWMGAMLMVMRLYDRPVGGSEALRRVPELIAAYSQSGPNPGAER